MFWQSEEDLSCPACQDVFQDPVLLSCSHSFCSSCLQNWWRGKPTRECPVCRTESEWTNPPRNLVLRNLCEAFLQQRTSSSSELLCSLHDEKLKLFCLDHQQPVCVVCRDAKLHSDHRFQPIDEAAQERREELQTSLKHLRDHIQVFQEVRVKCERTAEHIKVQSRNTERQIREKFEALHRFLEEEEKARMAALRVEEQQKGEKMQEKIAAVSRQIEALTDAVNSTEEQLRADNVSFLRRHQVALEKVQQLPAEPELPPGALLDVAKHLGNLSFSVWSRMKDMVSYSPVVLDPNTANPELVLSEDLTAVRYGRRQQRPENPERFEYWDAVLGSAFGPGPHSWEVEVGDNKDWELGVLAESVCRQDFMGTTVWSVEFNDVGYRVYSPTDRYVSLLPEHKLHRVKVHLDFHAGKLSFYEPESNMHLHTFTHTFTEKLRPFFCTRKTVPLRILPVALEVTVSDG